MRDILVAGLTCILLLCTAVAHAQTPPTPTPPAFDDTPFGFKRDERGRLLQTHFDLRRRYFASVQWLGSMDLTEDPLKLRSSTLLEVGGVYESYSEYKSRRNRFRYLEASLELDELEAHGLLLAYDRGRRSADPQIWITTFFGEPKRYDIAVDLGPGLIMGRFWVGPVEGREMGLVDIAQGHLNWEIFHGLSLEDYVLVRIGAGLGLRFYTAGGDAALYVYPELAARWAWLMGERGLTQLGIDARARLAHEPNSGLTWYEGEATIGLERILIAISDQPLAIYAEPGLHVLELGGRERLDARIGVGLRLSLFVPPREPDDLCPGEVEDFDGFQDQDGCPDY